MTRSSVLTNVTVLAALADTHRPASLKRLHSDQPHRFWIPEVGDGKARDRTQPPAQRGAPTKTLLILSLITRPEYCHCAFSSTDGRYIGNFRLEIEAVTSCQAAPTPTNT